MCDKVINIPFTSGIVKLAIADLLVSLAFRYIVIIFFFANFYFLHGDILYL